MVKYPTNGYMLLRTLATLMITGSRFRTTNFGRLRLGGLWLPSQEQLVDEQRIHQPPISSEGMVFDPNIVATPNGELINPFEEHQDDQSSVSDDGSFSSAKSSDDGGEEQ